MGEDMRWFDLKGDAIVRIKEWESAIKDVEDLDKSIALGRKFKNGGTKEAGLTESKEWDDTIMAFAHILHHTLDEMDEGLWLDLRWDLQEGWRSTEPGFWESPSVITRPYPLMRSDPRTNLDPAIRSLAHVIERGIVPELHRLIWCMLISSGGKLPIRELGLRERYGASTIVPTAIIDHYLDMQTPPFLDDDERKGMMLLSRRLKFGSTDGVLSDDLVEAICLGRYHIDGDVLRIDMNMRSRAWTAIDRKTVFAWTDTVMELFNVLTAFKVMFLASVVGESGPLRVDTS